MDRENTPQKKRGNRRNSVNAQRAFRPAQRPRSRTAAPPAAILSKQPVLLRPGSTPPSRVLYDPATDSRPTRELQVNTRANARAPSPRRSPPVMRRPTTPKVHHFEPPTGSVKLITPQMQFATDLAVKLGGCLEMTNFTVVGVLGLEGVGKSTVLSLLMEKPEVFPIQSLEDVVMGRHKTTGVDLAVSLAGGSGHPTVLLDSQPMLSSSILADLLARNESQRFGALSPEQQVEAASYQIAVFLCAICHYVVVVHDGLAFQLSAMDLLRQVEQKFSQCRLPSVSGSSFMHAAQLLYVANNMSEAELLYRENELFFAHARALEAAWPQAFYRVPNKLSHYCTEPDATDKSSAHPATFVLPHKQQQSSRRGSTPAKDSRRSTTSNAGDGKQKKRMPHVSVKYAEFDDAAEEFQDFVFSLPSSPSFTSQGSMLSSMPPGAKVPPPHALSLREWLSNASRVFEAVRKSSCFTAEYASRDYH